MANKNHNMLRFPGEDGHFTLISRQTGKEVKLTAQGDLPPNSDIYISPAQQRLVKKYLRLEEERRRAKSIQMLKSTKA